MFHFHRRAATLAIALMPAVTGAASLTLDQAVALAIQRSEAAKAARAETTSAREAARSAGQLPDPSLGVGIDNLPVTGPERFSTTQEPMTMKRIGIGQEWVSQEKRAARQAAADAMVDRQFTMVQVAEADVRLQTALAYIDAYYAGEARRLAELDEHHAVEALEAAKARLSSASGASEEVLAASSARGLAEDEVADAAQVQADAAVVLQRYAGISADELTLPAIPQPVLEAEFVAAAPAVRANMKNVDVARREAAVAATERRPNWSWQVSYGQRSGNSDLVSVSVSIPLPIAPAERQDRQTAARRALVEKTESELEESRRGATAEYRALASDVARLTQRIDRLQAAVLLPSHQRTEVALAGYRSNQVSLASVLEARHLEVEAQRKLLGLQRELARARAQLAYKPFPGDQP